MVLELATPLNKVALGQANLFGHDSLGILDKTNQITALYIATDDREPLTALPRYGYGPFDEFDVCDGRQGNPLPIGQSDLQGRHIGRFAGSSQKQRRPPDALLNDAQLETLDLSPQGIGQ